MLQWAANQHPFSFRNTRQEDFSVQLLVTFGNGTGRTHLKSETVFPKEAFIRGGGVSSIPWFPPVRRPGAEEMYMLSHIFTFMPTCRTELSAGQ